MAENRVIGAGNRMPWHLSADLKRFRQITLGKPILMGRKTYESIGRPLPERHNIVLTGNPRFRAPGCTVVDSLDKALAIAREAPELMVIGGAVLYRACLPWADRIYLTLIHQAFQGDTFLPEIDWTAWQEITRVDVDDDRQAGLSYSFIDYEKKPANEVNAGCSA